MPDDARSESLVQDVLVFPLGPKHALLIDHFTNMTMMQKRVCEDAVEEYRELQIEHAKALVEIARLTQQVAKQEATAKRPSAKPALRLRKR